MTTQPDPRPAVTSTGKSLMPAIHACRRQVAGLEDDQAWGDFLTKHAGKESLRFMNGAELGRVLDALHKAGAPKRPGRGAGRARLDTREQARMARGLWIELAKAGAVQDGSERALDAFCMRVTQKVQLAWCGPGELNKLIEALKDWRDRHDAADPVVLAAAGLDIPEGSTRDQALIPVLWEALIKAGAMATGAMARLDTWLLRNGGASSARALPPETAAVCAMKLGAWLRKHEAAAAQARRLAKREAAAAAKAEKGKERTDG